VHRLEELWDNLRALRTIAGEAKDEGEIDEWQWSRMIDRVTELTRGFERLIGEGPSSR
jgi:hypothetical protein